MKKRILFVLLACFVLISSLSGCQPTKTTDDGNKQVELHWVFGGPGKLEDSDRVWQEFNTQLADYLPNTSVKFTCIPHADFAEKWRLMSAAQENVDIAWVSWALNFVEEVNKGSYMDITDLVNEYGQDMKADFPDWLLGLTTINGKVYAIPNYQMMASPTGFSIDKHHVDNGWLDIKAAEELFASDKVLHKEDYKMFEEYIQKTQENGEQVKYISTQFLTRAIKNRIGLPAGGFEGIVANAVLARDEEGYKVYDRNVDFPDNYEYYDLVSEWYKKGYIRPDILENPTEASGAYLLDWTSIFKGTAERVSTKLGRPMEVFTMDGNLYVTHKGSSTNTAIASTSKNPVRAMQLLNIMNSKKGADLLNLLTYGFEGEHYKKVSDTSIEWLGAGVPGASDNKYGYENWALGNALVTYTTQSDPEGWNEYIHEDINMKAKMSRLSGFSIDLKPIKLQIAQYNAVMKEYEYIDKGTTPNYKELLEERNAKLIEAGSQQIIQEVQRQIDEWVAKQK